MKYLIAVLLHGLALAQNAQISGVVSDPAGARVSGAGITVVHEGTGIARTTQSNTAGIYALTSLRPGIYKIQARKAGFRTIVRQDLTLDVGQYRRVDFDLPVGDMREVVTVYGDRSQAGASESGYGVVVPRKFVNNLPINGRGLASLLDLAPGVLAVPVRGDDTGQFSVNGGRTTSNYVTIDGIAANFGIGSLAAEGGAVPSYSAIGSMHTLISIEALDEFRLITSSGGAEFGRLSGGQVVLHSRSGANEWSFGGFLVARNQHVDANDWFLNSRAQPRQPLRWWEGGGTFGGPIRRNRSFFFVAYDGFTMQQSSSALAVVPSLAARRAAPSSVQPLVDLFRLPNSAGPSPDASAFLGPSRADASLGALSARFDHALRPGLDLFARYQRTPSASRIYSVSTPTQTEQHYGLQQVTAGLNITHTPYVQQEARVGFGIARTVETYQLPPATAALIPSLLPPVTPPQLTLGLLSIGAYGPLSQGSAPPRSERQWNVTDTLSVLHGNHLIRTGIDLRSLRDRREALGYTVAGSFDDFNTLAAGALSTVAISRQDPYSIHVNQASAFLQDNWKLAPRVSLTMGLRFDWYGSPVPEDGARLWALGTDLRQLAAPGTPLWAARGTNFAPRIGVAWRVNRPGTWVMRAGAGLYYDAGQASLFSILQRQPLLGTATNFLFSILTPIDPAKIVPPTSLPGPPFATFAAFAPDFRAPHIWESNLTVERSFSTRSLASVSWIASAGLDLARREVGPVASPNFGILDLMTNYGRSDYNALQALFHLRAFRGLDLIASYNWSHSLDNSSRDTDMMLPGGSLLDRGNSSFDVRHSLTASFSYDSPRWRGWGLDGIWRVHSGFPVEMTSGFGASGLDNAYPPDYIAPNPIWLSDPHAPGGRILNPAAFSEPLPGSQGSLGRNAISGFGFAQIDLAIRREFRLAERGRLQVRAEAFNVTNRANFGNPIGALMLPTFGQTPGLLNSYLTSGGLLGVPTYGPNAGLVRNLQIGGPRVMQLLLRITF